MAKIKYAKNDSFTYDEDIVEHFNFFTRSLNVDSFFTNISLKASKTLHFLGIKRVKISTVMINILLAVILIPCFPSLEPENRLRKLTLVDFCCLFSIDDSITDFFFFFPDTFERL